MKPFLNEIVVDEIVFLFASSFGPKCFLFFDESVFGRFFPY